ncbi:MAG: sigma-70 family RNA polymerase sigma factor [Pseudolysinimonas sp.]
MIGGEVAAAVQHASRAESARIVATLVRITGDWDLAEDCMQDAFARAMSTWARDGIPSNPGAWLTTVAKNRAVDQFRRSAAERRAVTSLGIERELEQIGDAEMEVDEVGAQDRLTLMFTCCHPALPMEARVALTLRTVAGLGVAEIARAFLVSESTMQKRLVRARAKIKNAGIPYRIPPLAQRLERLEGVQAVLYLLFNEGYSSTENERWVREPIAAEAIRLERMLIDSLEDSPPGVAEARSLLALMLLQHARRHARVDSSGDLVVLEDQDRSLWDSGAIQEAVVIVDELERDLARDGSAPGQYFLQAAIAACHAAATSFESTDFMRIATLYRQLAESFPSPVIDLNYAVSRAMADGPGVALPLVEALDEQGTLDGYYLLPATRADLLRRLGRDVDAMPHYRRALSLAPSPAERRYLEKRMRELTQ